LPRWPSSPRVADRLFAPLSLGGYRLACERANRIAGVGSVAGAMILDDCQPSQPVSVIEIYGTALAAYTLRRAEVGRS